MAKSFKALIIPVLASDGKLPIAICNLQSVKLFGDKKEEEWVLLLERILKHLKIYKKASVEAEIKYLKNLLQDNDQSSLDFAGKVYVPQSGKLHKERKLIPVAAMTPLLLHRRRTEYEEPQEQNRKFTKVQ